MRPSFQENIEFRLQTCGGCLLQFYIPDNLATGPRWREPIWCPNCHENARRTPSEVEMLRRQNAGLRGALSRAKKRGSK